MRACQRRQLQDHLRLGRQPRDELRAVQPAELSEQGQIHELRIGDGVGARGVKHREVRSPLLCGVDGHNPVLRLKIYHHAQTAGPGGDNALRRLGNSYGTAQGVDDGYLSGKGREGEKCQKRC